VLIEETIQKLIAMKMPSMAEATREVLQSSPSHQMSFEEKLGLVVDREWSDRDNRRIARRLKEAKLGVGASLEAIDCDATRGLDKALVRQLMTCQWAKQKQNVIITGATGTGKVSSLPRSPKLSAAKACEHSSYECRASSKSSQSPACRAVTRRVLRKSHASMSSCSTTFF
jgi:flagellar biosynthesis GTPase FlhF